MRRTLSLGLIAVLLISWSSTSAFAIDKRVRLMFKTAGYGAAAGLVIGTGTWALGMGGPRNALMGASAGMYAGILLAAYIAATPEPRGRKLDAAQGPRAPVRDDDWEYEPQDEELLKEHIDLPQEDMDSGAIDAGGVDKFVVWAPLFSVRF